VPPPRAVAGSRVPVRHFHPVGWTVLPWLGRSPRRPVEPFASPRNPSTDASVSRCRPHDRLSSAAVLSARLPRTVPSARREPRVSPRPVGPFPHAAHHRCRFPEPKRLPPMSPSAPTWIDASPSRVPRACRAPGLTSACARELSDQSHYFRITFATAFAGVLSETGGRRRCARGAKALWPGFRHAFTSWLTPAC
jgi:hypothetical protein